MTVPILTCIDSTRIQTLGTLGVLFAVLGVSTHAEPAEAQRGVTDATVPAVLVDSLRAYIARRWDRPTTVSLYFDRTSHHAHGVSSSISATMASSDRVIADVSEVQSCTPGRSLPRGGRLMPRCAIADRGAIVELDALRMEKDRVTVTFWYRIESGERFGANICGEQVTYVAERAAETPGGWRYVGKPAWSYC